MCSRSEGLCGSGPPDDESGVRQLAEGVPLISVAGRVTARAARRLRRIAQAQLASRPRLMVLDLRAVTGVAPEGVETLVAIAYDAGAGAVGLCLVCGRSARHPVRSALRDAGSLELFEFQPDPDAALGTLD